jgi:plastocyanin
MARRLVRPLVGIVAIVVVAGGVHSPTASGQTAKYGTIRGHIRLSGKPPGNPVIRMGMDPMCAKINRGKQVVQENVAAAADGSLKNVFVTLQGPFPQTPAPPSTPVVIDQRGCIYTPRVVGIRVGQTLQVLNSDELLHNVHGLSARSNGFNVSQPKAGMVQQFRVKDEEIMLRLKCDVHSWMTAHVGVVNHPYFAVSDASGAFEIANVPAGTRKLQIWHEQYGVLTRTAEVKAGATTTVDFMYTGNEKPSAGRTFDLVLPHGVTAVQLQGQSVW